MCVFREEEAAWVPRHNMTCGFHSKIQCGVPFYFDQLCVCVLGWERSTLLVWSASTCSVSWPRCTTSAGLSWPPTCLMSESSRPQNPTTSTWVSFFSSSSSAYCLSSTPSCPCRRPLTVGPLGHKQTYIYTHTHYIITLWCFHTTNTFYINITALAVILIILLNWKDKTKSSFKNS